ncbi:MAG: helix-turn-helix transcriptional regulator, partial [Alphaproteobacteria bacterium]|nr:helix-turn-helix transcriptional regulator [Alphaproteobacteria bacterium]
MGKKQRITKNNLRALLKEKGHTYVSLAEHLGVSYQQAQKYGNGSNEMSLKLLMETCKLLDCYPEQVYPEIEMYDKGFHVPKTLSTPIEDAKLDIASNETAINSEDLIKNTNEKNITINNHTTTNNIYKSNFFEDFFSN